MGVLLQHLTKTGKERQYDNTWKEGTSEDVGDSCCEEHILEGLNVAGIQHTYKFEKDEDEHGENQ